MPENLTIFGDSICKGVRWDTESGRYRLCEHKNFEALTQFGIPVYNYAKMGATVWDGLKMLERHAKNLTEGDTVLLEFGGNDCDFDWNEVSEKPAGAHQPHLSPDDFLTSYRSLIRGVRQTGAGVALASPLPIHADRYFDWISRGRNAENLLCWLGDREMLARWQETYATAVRELAWEENCPLLDLRTVFLCRHDFRTLLCEDGIHPTQAGHDLIEQTLLDFFQTNS